MTFERRRKREKKFKCAIKIFPPKIKDLSDFREKNGKKSNNTVQFYKIKSTGIKL